VFVLPSNQKLRFLVLSGASLSSGLLLALSFPPLNYSLLSAFAVVPLMIALTHTHTWFERWLLGTLMGCVFWGGTCYWVYDVMHRYAHLSASAAMAIFIGFFVIKGIHSGLFAVLAGPLLKSPWAIPTISLAWVALEGTHQFIFTWLHLGNAAINMSVVARIAPYTGVYGLSFVLMVINTAVVILILKRPRKQLLWLSLPLLLYGLPGVPERRNGTETARLIQPNIHPDEVIQGRWTRQRATKHRTRMAVLSMDLESELTVDKPSMIIWPEYTIPAYYFDDPDFKMYIGELARQANAYMIFNTVEFSSTENGPRPLNSALTIDPNGDLVSHYSKRFLVPFGEFVPWPFSLVINRITVEAGDFLPGDDLSLAPIGDHTLGTFICYESVFAEGVREFVAAGAEVLVNISNDSWYGQTAARKQHLLIARMRALENQRWLLRATNDGITAIIDPGGRLQGWLPSFKEGVLTGHFNYESTLTWFSQFGEWFWWLSIAGTGLAIFVCRRTQSSL
tara:strand:+ start:5368 stop:6891 length:1524 start_codon:yes stop_codon:yes gene_type:complete